MKRQRNVSLKQNLQRMPFGRRLPSHNGPDGRAQSHNPDSLRDKLKRLLHVEMPYTVEARDISLLLLWKPGTPEESAVYGLPEGFKSMPTTIGGWLVEQVFQQPLPGSEHASWLSKDEVVQSIKELIEGVRQMATNTGRPAYVVLHIPEMQVQKPLLYRFYRERSKALVDEACISAKWLLVDDAQHVLSGLVVPAQSSWGLNTFEHYDHAAHQRGWLIISPMWALLAGVSENEARVLTSLLQPRESAQKQPGIASEHYAIVLERVAQWNSTQDMFEAVDRLAEVAKSGTISTKGQLWVSYALAAIGVLLALTSIYNPGTLLIIPILLFVVSSFFHAIYAGAGKGWAQFIGRLFFFVAFAVAFILFWSALTKLPGLLRPFLLRLF